MKKAITDLIKNDATPYTESDLALIEAARQSLLQKLQSITKKPNLELINYAIDFAAEAHKGQYRASGDPYILHPIAVAEIVLELKIDTSTIITALLHDTIEDTNVTSQIIAEGFGNEVSKLVDGVTKLAKIEYQPEHVKQAENFRKLLLAISEDIRVLLVKLADRLHNMRTIKHIRNQQKRIRIAYETMEIYSPLAERIGIHRFKNELQDIAFAELHPEIRKSILNRLEFLRKEGQSLVETIVKEISETVKDSGIEATVTGREKTSCSIWRKMEYKNVAFEQLADIIAFRVMVEKVEDCYKALGAIHVKYHMVPGGFKDFISTPKANGYQSLHTLVMGPEQRCIEIQIRTYEMHKVAELGVAAHWTYKQKVDSSTEGTQFRWIRELLEILDNASSAQEFLENTKLEMYYDQVFCFTPKGDLIALPKGATPVDFAFALHSNIGLSCIGARVNGRIVPLKSQLENGDQVEILRSKTPVPSPGWEKFVVTGKARAEIRKFIRSKQREEYYNLGKAVLTKTFQQSGHEFKEENLTQVLDQLKCDTTEELIVSVGEGVINRMDVVNALYPENKVSDKRSLNPLSLLKFKTKKPEMLQNQSIPIKGLIPGMAIHFAGCCHPLPGDRIVGIVNTGKGITIHTADCEMLENFTNTPEKWIDVTWEGIGDEQQVGRIKVTVSNEFGSLAEVTRTIAQDLANITNIKVIGRSLDFFELLLDVEVKGVNQLTNLIISLRALDCVHSVDRYKV
ncbi:MAG: guanosine polyphosphate pyrophosphohydrolase/synthetase [Candidatus Midichloriaceae bacterium]|jgi:GTP pyrophosphokinase|nr:guanosine polyphosphate pyrophosphohydrolase/synthetase [Candidatus Midichloriaceae bacterium]